MKSTLLICLLGCISFSLLAQDTLSKKSGYFTVVKKNSGSGQNLSVGDKIAISLKGNKQVRGKMVEANREYILIDSKGKIEIANIKWIKKTKPESGRLVGGLIFTAIGSGMLIYAAQGHVDLDAVPIIVGIGVGFIGVGVGVINPPKYKLHKGDMIIFKE